MRLAEPRAAYSVLRAALILEAFEPAMRLAELLAALSRRGAAF